MEILGDGHSNARPEDSGILAIGPLWFGEPRMQPAEQKRRDLELSEAS